MLSSSLRLFSSAAAVGLLALSACVVAPVFVAAITFDGTTKQFSLGGTGYGLDVSLSYDLHTAFVSTCDNTIAVVELKSGATNRYQAPDALLSCSTSVVVDRKRKNMYVTDYYGILSRMDMATKKWTQLATDPDPKQAYMGLRFTHDETALLVAEQSGAVSSFNLTTKESTPLVKIVGSVGNMQLNKAGTKLFLGAGHLRILDLADGTVTTANFTLLSTYTVVQAVTLSADEKGVFLILEDPSSFQTQIHFADLATGATTFISDQIYQGSALSLDVATNMLLVGDLYSGLTWSVNVTITSPPEKEHHHKVRTILNEYRTT